MADEEVASESSSDVEPSLRETLEAAYKEHSEPEAEVATAEPEPKAEPKERPRDESGRFQASEPTPTAEPLTPTPESVPAVTAEPAPNSWTAAAKADWEKVPAPIRAEIHRREQDVHRQFTKIDEERTFAREMQRVVGPYEPMIRAAGARVPDAIASVLNTAYVLRTADPATKAREIASVCQQYGVDLSLVAQPPPIDPQVAAANQRVAQLERAFREQQQQHLQKEETEVYNLVESFGKDPKHPHFLAVRAEMGALMQAGVAKDLEDAYQRAVWANSDVRPQLLAAQTAQQKGANAQVIQRARTRGVSVRGGPGGTPPAAPNPNASVREDLMSAFEEVRGRV